MSRTSSRCAVLATALVLTGGLLGSLSANVASSQELADPASARSGETPRDRELPPESPIGWAIQSLGVFYSAVFSALAVTLIALLVLNLMGLRRNEFMPGELVVHLRERFRRRRYREGRELASADRSPLGQVVAAGMAALPLGYEQAVEVMQQTEHEQTMAAEHRLGYLALIGTVAPMIGLMGTVQGMIASFSEIAYAETVPAPWVLARGISTALFTTLVGLSLAIPAIASFNVLRNRVARMRLELGQFCEELLRHAATSAR